MQQKIGLIITGKDRMKNFCNDLKEQATKIINYEKKDMIPLLTYEENKFYKKQKFVIYLRKNLILIKMIQMHLYYTIKRLLSLYWKI